MLSISHVSVRKITVTKCSAITPVAIISQTADRQAE